MATHQDAIFHWQKKHKTATDQQQTLTSTETNVSPNDKLWINSLHLNFLDMTKHHWRKTDSQNQIEMVEVAAHRRQKQINKAPPPRQIHGFVNIHSLAIEHSNNRKKLKKKEKSQQMEKSTIAWLSGARQMKTSRCNERRKNEKKTTRKSRTTHAKAQANNYCSYLNKSRFATYVCLCLNLLFCFLFILFHPSMTDRALLLFVFIAFCLCVAFQAK